MKKINYAIMGLLLSIPVATFAQVPTSVTPVGSADDLTVSSLLVNIINWVLGFSAAIAVLFLIFGGILYVVSAGNADRSKQARQTILYAVIGLIVIVLSFVIVDFVMNNVGKVL
jgi:hypothetical protein